MTYEPALASGGRGQQIVGLGLISAFYAAAFLAPHRIVLLFTGTLAIGCSLVISRALGPTKAAGVEVLAVFAIAFVLIALPPATSPPLGGATGAAILLGVTAAQAVWAIHRYPPLPPKQSQPLSSRILAGAVAGAFAGVLLLAVGVIAVVVQLLNGKALLPLGVLALAGLGYVIGGSLAGAVTFALAPIWRWPLGIMLAGLLGGVALFAAIVPALTYPEATPFGEHFTLALLAAWCLGPQVGLRLGYG